MLKNRLIPCLDVANGKVVKGVQFRNHEIIGDILGLAQAYAEDGADELVFYDITASTENRSVDLSWVSAIARAINIPFCVAGGISSLAKAEEILSRGADKISINSPAIFNPELISIFARRFGSQAVVVGIDSYEENGDYHVYALTGKTSTSKYSGKSLLAWAQEVVNLGAGEIVLNCMNQDGQRSGYDLYQLNLLASQVSVPVVASGGAGCMKDFLDLFTQTSCTAGLAASVFHKKIFTISELKSYLLSNKIKIRN